MSSIDSFQPPPISGEPGFEEYLDNQALLQQLHMAQHFQTCLDADPTDKVAAAGFLKALALVERSRTRISRPTKYNRYGDSKLPRERRERPDRDDACEFLKAELTPGPRPVCDLFPRARLLGISPMTLRRAKNSLNIHSNLHVMSDKDRFWTWALPEHAAMDVFYPPQPFLLSAANSVPVTQDSSTPSAANLNPNPPAKTPVSSSKSKDDQVITRKSDHL